MAARPSLTDGADALADLAVEVLQAASALGLRLATAESCTGGLVASLLTDIEGCSGAFERGFVTYTDEAKAEMLGVDPIEIARHGAVSREVAALMAQGALRRSRSQVAIAVTGFAGPAGANEEEGLVHLAGRSTRGHAIDRECHFGSAGRELSRVRAAQCALEMFAEILGGWDGKTG